MGAPGLNLGLQDAANLGWKLAAQIHGWSPPGLLDTYHTERRPVAERLVLHSQAQTALMAPGEGITALRAVFGELLQDKESIQRIADLMAGTDVCYPTETHHETPTAHPLAGRFAPELRLDTKAGPTRLAELMRSTRPLMLNLGGLADLPAVVAPWKDRVDVITARCPDTSAAALLIRPDGYVAWAAAPNKPEDRFDSALKQALTLWFGTGRTTR